MADKILENNQVSIVGEIISDFQYSHEVYGEGFYICLLYGRGSGQQIK